MAFTTGTEADDSALIEDARDRRAALEAALDATSGISIRHENVYALLTMADQLYEWLRQRDTLQVTLSIEAGPVEDQPAPSPAKKGK